MAKRKAAEKPVKGIGYPALRKQVRKIKFAWTDEDGDYCVVTKLDDSTVTCYSSVDGARIGVDHRPSSAKELRRQQDYLRDENRRLYAKEHGIDMEGK